MQSIPLKASLVLLIVALMVGSPPASAASPFVLAQFFEHFDGEPEDEGAFDPDLPYEEFGFEDIQPDDPDTEALAPPQAPNQAETELGFVPPAFDPADRPELLAGLYEKLAAAKTPEEAKPIAMAIEELWTLSGSDTVDLLMARAAHFAGTRETKLSLSILDAVVDIAPDEAEVWYLRAKVNAQSGKPERALADLRRALNLDEKHYRAIADLGLLLEEFGAKKEALEAYRRALAVNPFLEDAQSGAEALAREVEGQDI